MAIPTKLMADSDVDPIIKLRGPDNDRVPQYWKNLIGKRMRLSEWEKLGFSITWDADYNTKPFKILGGFSARFHVYGYSFIYAPPEDEEMVRALELKRR